jgi:hypothetical protein
VQGFNSLAAWVREPRTSAKAWGAGARVSKHLTIEPLKYESYFPTDAKGLVSIHCSGFDFN